MLGHNASRVKIYSALSPITNGAAGSTNAVDLSGFAFATVIAHVGSGGSGGAGNRLMINVLRSATSDGTFSTFGASLPSLSALNQVHARSFAIDSSANWHKVSYDNTNGGSVTYGVLMIAQAARSAPVDNEANVVTYSDVIGG